MERGRGINEGEKMKDAKKRKNPWAERGMKRGNREESEGRK